MTEKNEEKCASCDEVHDRLPDGMMTVVQLVDLLVLHHPCARVMVSAEMMEGGAIQPSPFSKIDDVDSVDEAGPGWVVIATATVARKSREAWAAMEERKKAVPDAGPG